LVPISDNVTSIAVAPPTTPAATCPAAAKPINGNPTATAARSVTPSASGAEPILKRFAYLWSRMVLIKTNGRLDSDSPTSSYSSAVTECTRLYCWKQRPIQVDTAVGRCYIGRL